MFIVFLEALLKRTFRLIFYSGLFSFQNVHPHGTTILHSILEKNKSLSKILEKTALDVITFKLFYYYILLLLLVYYYHTNIGIS